MLNIQYAAQQGIAGFPHVVFKVPAAHIIFFPPGGEPHPFLIQRRYSYKVGPGGGAGTGAAAAVVELKTDAFFLPESGKILSHGTDHRDVGSQHVFHALPKPAPGGTPEPMKGETAAFKKQIHPRCQRKAPGPQGIEKGKIGFFHGCKAFFILPGRYRPVFIRSRQLRHIRPPAAPAEIQQCVQRRNEAAAAFFYNRVTAAPLIAAVALRAPIAYARISVL